MQRPIRTTANPSPSLPSRREIRSVIRAARNALLAAALALAGCVTPPVSPPKGPAHAVFTPATYAELPGWNDDAQQTAWPAFLVGCKALVARARSQALWQAPCAAANAIDARDANTAKLFLAREL